MKLRPLRDQVLIKRDEAKSETDGGLIIPDSAQVKSRHGKILAVGPGRYRKNSGERIPVSLTIGSTVYFRGTSGLEVEIDNEKFVLLRENDVEGVVELT